MHLKRFHAFGSGAEFGSNTHEELKRKTIEGVDDLIETSDIKEKVNKLRESKIICASSYVFRQNLNFNREDIQDLIDEGELKTQTLPNHKKLLVVLKNKHNILMEEIIRKITIREKIIDTYRFIKIDNYEFDGIIETTKNIYIVEIKSDPIITPAQYENIFGNFHSSVDQLFTNIPDKKIKLILPCKESLHIPKIGSDVNMPRGRDFELLKVNDSFFEDLYDTH